MHGPRENLPSRRHSDSECIQPRIEFNTSIKNTSCPNLDKLSIASKVYDWEVVPISDSDLPMKSIKILYNDRQYLPPENKAEIRDKPSHTIRAIQYAIIVLPFILDYVTDITSSGTGLPGIDIR